MLSRFFTLRYWLLPTTGLMSAKTQLAYALLASIYAAGMVVALYAALQNAQSRVRPLLTGLACIAGILGTVNRFLDIVPFARWQIVLPAGVVIFLYCLPFGRATWPAFMESWSALWNWRVPTSRLSWQPATIIVIIHLVALSILTRPLGWSLKTVPFIAIIGLCPQLVPAIRRKYSTLVLNALSPCYLLGTVEIIGRLGWQASIITPPVLTLALVLGLGYALSYQVLTYVSSKWVSIITWFTVAICGTMVLAWALWTYISLAARGVAGSDPYAYIQMAIDWARTGSFLHHFPLAQFATEAGVNLEPILHTGYRLPLYHNEWAATVWPVGHAWLLGLIGRLFGLEAVYRGTPVLAVLAVVASALLALFASHSLGLRLSWVVAILAGFITATSFELVSWTLVHMADISALLFSVCCFILAWQSSRRSAWGWLMAAASGVCLGMAYWARHTQLVMLIPACLLILGERKEISWGSRLLRMAVLGIFALMVALPDLAYHRNLFGSIWSPESNELSLYSLAAIPRSTWLLITQWSASREFLFLLPLFFIGGYSFYCRQRLICIASLLWLGASWAIHAPYSALRLRDLLPVLPVLALYTAYGIVVSLRWLAQRRRSLAVATLFVLVVLLYLRSGKTINLPISHGYNNFGYLWASQRQEFTNLKEIILPNAVIAATLDSGPLDLYAGKQTFQPVTWSDEDLQRFISLVQAQGMPLYLLDDSLVISKTLSRWRGFASLSAVATLHQVPYYYPGGGSDNRDIVLYLVQLGPD